MDNSRGIPICRRAKNSQLNLISENLLFPQNLLHRFALCKFIDQPIQITNGMHSWIFDLFYSYIAYYTSDQSPSRIELRIFREEGFKVCLFFSLVF